MGNPFSSDWKRRPRRAARVATVLLALGSLTPSRLAAAQAGSIEIRSPAPPAAERLARMRAWHASYRRAMEPLRGPLEALARALRNERLVGLAAACKRFSTALADVEPAALFPVPDFATAAHLQAAVTHLSRASAACRADRPTEAAHQVEEAGRAFANAALALRRFGLEP